MTPESREAAHGRTMAPSADAAAQGHYYRKLLGCRSGVIAWSHRARFRRALHLVGPATGRLLDYGCGDGTFLAMAAPRISEGWGADVALDQIEDCRRRFSGLPNLHFCSVAALGDGTRDGSYDLVTCMETLEHCTAPVVEIVLGDLARLAAPGGRIVISVPIEIGPTFLLKTAIRRLAAWRGLSDYRFYESYTPRAAWQMVFAKRGTTLDRPVYGAPEAPYHSHYGFNWRAMRERVSAHLRVERTMFTPLGALGGWVSSQAWFVCQPPRPAMA